MTDQKQKPKWWWLAGVLTALLLTACATPQLEAPPQVAAGWPQGWMHFTLPGKTPSDYKPDMKQGRPAMRVSANASASILRKDVRIEPQDLSQIRFSWHVPELIANADLAVREQADSPVRIVLAFEGDRSRFSAKESMLSEMARLVTGEPMPYATLMYVWSNKHPAGTIIRSSRTDRIRKLVVESGGTHLNQWLDYKRDVRADYEKAFGEPPGALVAIGIMTDTDNTRSKARAWYGPVTLTQK
ncbi:MAG: hypothetical protein RLZZ126_241 [Pseudomonadota bacterium]